MRVQPGVPGMALHEVHMTDAPRLDPSGAEDGRAPLLQFP
jgi:hypothetical protein